MDLRAHAVNSYFTRSGSLVWSGVIEDFSSVDQPILADGFAFDPVNTVMLVSNQDQITGNVRFNGAGTRSVRCTSGGHALVKSIRGACRRIIRRLRRPARRSACQAPRFAPGPRSTPPSA